MLPFNRVDRNKPRDPTAASLGTWIVKGPASDNGRQSRRPHCKNEGWMNAGWFVTYHEIPELLRAGSRAWASATPSAGART